MEPILTYYLSECHQRKSKPKCTQLVILFLTRKNTINIENDVKAFKQSCTESQETE